MSERSHTIDIELNAVRGAAMRQSGYALVFLVLQAPMVHAVWTEAVSEDRATSTLRLSLALQVAFGFALGLAGYRVTEFLLARERRLVDRGPGERAVLERKMDRRRPYLFTGCALLVAAGVVAVVEVLTLLGPVSLDDSGLQRVANPWLAALWLLLLVAGAVLLTGVRFQVLPLPRRLPTVSDLRHDWSEGLLDKLAESNVKTGEPRLSAVVQPPAPQAGRPRRIITCSGGGIRSASFCLGALQALTTAKIYHGSDAVVGVSGGGYMAAAFHYTGRTLKPSREGLYSQPPFAHGTAELALLRRHTRYLLPSSTEIFRGVLSVIWGVLVNLAIIAVVLRAMAWVLGWYLYRFDVVEERGDSLVVDMPTAWVVVALVPWGLAVAAFVLHDKLVERFVTTPDAVRRGVRKTIQHSIVVGTGTAVLLLGVPLALGALDDLAGSQGTLPEAITRVTEPGAWAIGSLAGTITALITLGRTVWKGLEDAQPKEGRLAKVAARLRTVLAPWLGTAIILIVIFVLLVRWTEGYATSATWRADWRTGLLFAAMFLLVRILTDANRTSLHHFYRERLASAYLVDRVRSDPDDEVVGDAEPQQPKSADAPSYRTPMRVSRFARRNGGGGPELVMAAVANVTDQGFVPSGRGCVPFVIAADETGIAGDRSLPPGGTKPTELYEDFADYDGRDLTVPAAMAISGAAFSPLVGRASARTRPVRVLLTVLNARLGVWLPNPYLSPPGLVTRASTKRANGTVPSWHLRWGARLMSVVGKPGPYRLLREAFGAPSLSDRKLYITDGGHYDNLGLLEALRRRPEEIYVIDASNDKENSFGALAEAIATARMDLGVEVTINVAKLRSTKEGRAARAWAKGTATHDDGTPPTRIYYLKAIMLDDLSNDLEHYARENADFPRRSTGRQLYDEWDFEAYRELGESLAERMLTNLRLVTVAPRQRGEEPTPVKDLLAMDRVDGHEELRVDPAEAATTDPASGAHN